MTALATTGPARCPEGHGVRGSGASPVPERTLRVVRGASRGFAARLTTATGTGAPGRVRRGCGRADLGSRAEPMSGVLAGGSQPFRGSVGAAYPGVNRNVSKCRRPVCFFRYHGAPWPRGPSPTGRAEVEPARPDLLAPSGARRPGVRSHAEPVCSCRCTPPSQRSAVGKTCFPTRIAAPPATRTSGTPPSARPDRETRLENAESRR